MMYERKDRPEKLNLDNKIWDHKEKADFFSIGIKISMGYHKGLIVAGSVTSVRTWHEC